MVVVVGSGRVPFKPSTKRTVATKVCRKNASSQPVWYLSGKKPEATNAFRRPKRNEA